MISGDEFIRFAKNCFRFLIDELGYVELSVTNRTGIFYDVEYKKDDMVISISYENRENYLQVLLLKLQKGIKPDYDDKKHTIHLERLNSQVLNLLSNAAYKENDSFFLQLKLQMRFNISF